MVLLNLPYSHRLSDFFLFLYVYMPFLKHF
nr:MAG TPA: hypothetical protein [Caudoviricetes sp.]